LSFAARSHLYGAAKKADAALKRRSSTLVSAFIAALKALRHPRIEVFSTL
jgi:hypothetical protein